MKFAIGAVNMKTQTIFNSFEMDEMNYLKEESLEKFSNEIKPIKFKNIKMQPSDNLTSENNLNCGFLKVYFTISNGIFL